MSTNLCYSLAKGPIKIKCYWSVLMAEWLRRVLCQVAAASLFWFQMWSFDACCAPIRANVCLCIILYNKGKNSTHTQKKIFRKQKRLMLLPCEVDDSKCRHWIRWWMSSRHILFIFYGEQKIWPCGAWLIGWGELTDRSLYLNFHKHDSPSTLCKWSPSSAEPQVSETQIKL